jgi:hypothetical protein
MTTLSTVQTHDSFELGASDIAFAVFHIVARIDRLRFTSIFAYFAAGNTGHIGGIVASGHFDNSGLK